MFLPKWMTRVPGASLAGTAGVGSGRRGWRGQGACPAVTARRLGGVPLARSAASARSAARSRNWCRIGVQILQVLREDVARGGRGQHGIHQGALLGHLEHGVVMVGGIVVLDLLAALGNHPAPAFDLERREPLAPQEFLGLGGVGLAQVPVGARHGVVGRLPLARAKTVFSFQGRAHAHTLADEGPRADARERASDAILPVAALAHALIHLIGRGEAERQAKLFRAGLEECLLVAAAGDGAVVLARFHGRIQDLLDELDLREHLLHGRAAQRG